MSLYTLRVNLMNGFKPEKGKSQGFVWRLKTITGEHELNCIMNWKQKAKLLLPQLTPTTFISKNAKIGSGSQIMAGSAIAPEVEIGQGCIINTNATVYHESFLESIASSSI